MPSMPFERRAQFMRQRRKQHGLGAHRLFGGVGVAGDVARDGEPRAVGQHALDPFKAPAIRRGASKRRSP